MLCWNYILEALNHVGCGKAFRNMVGTCLGNASTRVNVDVGK